MGWKKEFPFNYDHFGYLLGGYPHFHSSYEKTFIRTQVLSDLPINEVKALHQAQSKGWFSLPAAIFGMEIRQLWYHGSSMAGNEN